MKQIVTYLLMVKKLIYLKQKWKTGKYEIMWIQDLKKSIGIMDCLYK